MSRTFRSNLIAGITALALTSGASPAVVAALASSAADQATGETVVTAGPVSIRLIVSRTAHLFHIVDQLAEWSPYCHRQYRSYFESLAAGGFSKRDRELLASHARVRCARGWGHGLEQTFYTAASLEKALAQGIAGSQIDPAQANLEREVFKNFATRIDSLMRDHSDALESFRADIVRERESLASFLTSASRFFHVDHLEVSVFLIASPSNHGLGGGYNGERLTLEVGDSAQTLSIFRHELFHAFTHARKEILGRAVIGVQGLDEQTLNEGLAYALAPGLYHATTSGADPLARDVAADLGAHRSLKEPYVASRRLGLGLRPILKEALADPSETIDRFLPRAVDVWKSIAELSAACDGG